MPEELTVQNESKERLCRKFIVRKTNDEDIDPEAKYFVVRYDRNAKHGSAGRAALETYYYVIEDEMPELAKDLMEDLIKEGLLD